MTVAIIIKLSREPDACGQPLNLVGTACIEVLKPKGFKKYRKKFLTNKNECDIIYKLSRTSDSAAGP